MNFLLFAPEFVVLFTGFAVLGLDLVMNREKSNYLPGVCVSGLVVSLLVTLLYLGGKDTDLYGGIFLIDNFSLLFRVVFLVIGIFIVLMSVDYVKIHLSRSGEFYGILMFSVLAMMLMAASGELLTAYISLELLSFSLYVLVAYGREGLKPSEASIKYILLGAFASALLLYGISQIYGLLGTTKFAEIYSVMSENGDPMNLGLLVALVLMIAGLGFKVAAVPFHMWAPDVYEGAPIPVTAYLSVGSKIAAFALVLRLFSQGLLPTFSDWQPIILMISALTMTIGNLVALVQHNIKRLLAYSSVGQVGYLLMGIAALSTLASNGLIFHLIGYGVTNLAVFLVIIIVYNSTKKEEIVDFAGLSERAPFVAMALSVGLFSLAGLPFFAGFTTKFYLFTAVADEGLLWLVGLAITNSLISLYYYLLIIKQMYMHSYTASDTVEVSRLNGAVLWILVMGIVVIGIYPGPLVKAIEAATAAIL